MNRGIAVSLTALILAAAGCGQGSFSETPQPVIEKLRAMDEEVLFLVRRTKGKGSDGKIHVDDGCPVLVTAINKTYGISRERLNEKVYVSFKNGRLVSDQQGAIDLKIALCESCVE